MSRSVAQPLTFTLAVIQTFDLQPSEDRHSLAQSLQFTTATAYLLFDIRPSNSLPTD
jgi:hypothetical protein